MCKALAVLLAVLFIVSPVYAQHETGAGDRLGKREVDWSQPSIARWRLAPTPPTTNLYAKAALTDVDDDISPSVTLGLNHKEEQHPWYAEAGYKYGAGSNSHHSLFSATGNYQLWTGMGKLSPLLQFETDYANRFSSSQRLDSYFVGELTAGIFSLDAIVGGSASKPQDGKRISDFVPGLSAIFSLPAGNLLEFDYTFNNKVDDEDSFDVAFRHKFPRGFAVDLVAFKHSDFRIRIRKDLESFKPRSSR